MRSVEGYKDTPIKRDRRAFFNENGNNDVG